MCNTSLIERMHDYGHTVCSDPRDLVYALLSISRDYVRGNNPVPINYSMDKEDLFINIGKMYATSK